jgi:glycosidase
LKSPLAGDPVEENAMGYLMRNAQWLVQVIGVEGFRIDAAKHVPGFVLDFFDRAVYRASPRQLLNGNQKHVFSFGESNFDNREVLLTYVKKTINPGEPGRIGGNRDTLDFALFFRLGGNLTSNGIANDWRNIADADVDFQDDGLHNGSAGVKFVSSHDDFGPHLDNVGYAYTLMLPGNAIVYHDSPLGSLVQNPTVFAAAMSHWGWRHRPYGVIDTRSRTATSHCARPLAIWGHNIA